MQDYKISIVIDFKVLETLPKLQIEAWGFDPMEAVPAHVLLAAAKEAGQVLVAFGSTGQPVAFTLGFLAKDRVTSQEYLLSHMLAVKPGLQSRSIGYEMKMAQRREALNIGITEIRWTYDPLLTRNANLNLRKLGAKVFSFIENKYGAMQSGLYGELPTDRFVVTWDLNNSTPDYFCETAEILLTPSPENMPLYNPQDLRTENSHYLCQVPLNHEQLRKSNPEMAAKWQMTIRAIAHELLDGRYAVAGFRVNDADNLGEYLFERV